MNNAHERWTPAVEKAPSLGGKSARQAKRWAHRMSRQILASFEGGSGRGNTTLSAGTLWPQNLEKRSRF